MTERPDQKAIHGAMAPAADDVTIGAAAGAFERLMTADNVTDAKAHALVIAMACNAAPGAAARIIEATIQAAYLAGFAVSERRGNAEIRELIAKVDKMGGA